MTNDIPSGIRDFLFDLAKIVEGAANSDFSKVLAYGEQLAARLSGTGELQGAKRLREILSKSKANKLSLARGSGEVTPAVPVDSESRLSIADEELPGSGKVQLFLPPSPMAQLDHYLKCIKAADKLVSGGVPFSGSLLLFGPPGCGKTQVARFVASELGLPLLTARADALISSFLGSTSKNVRHLFEHAASRRCVLFLDEFDALAKMRDDAAELGELKRVVISLLQNIDALGPEHILLAATNHEHLLDPAVWRRFTHRIRISEPDEAARLAMFQAFLGKHATESQAVILAALSEGMSGSVIRQMSEDAIRTAILDNSPAVNTLSFVDRILIEQHGAGVRRTLRDKIVLVRKSTPKSFTQQKIAELFGVSQSYVSKILGRTEEKHG